MTSNLLAALGNCRLRAVKPSKPRRKIHPRRWRCESLEQRTLLDGLGVLPSSLAGTIAFPDDVHETSLYLTGGTTVSIHPVQGTSPDRATAPGVELYNAAGELLSASHDGHAIRVTVPATGEYPIRISSANEQRTFLGDYEVSLSESPFAGTLEVEPNDAIFSGGQLATPVQFGGSLSSPGDVDYFRFTASAGQVVAVKLANRPAGNPAVRLYDPAGQLLASGLDGNGLAARTPVAGSFALSIAADNSHGTVTGEYYGSLVAGANGVLEDGSEAAIQRASPLAALTQHVVPSAFLRTSAGAPGGLTGSYVNAWLGWVSSPADWRQTQTIAGSRTDAILDFDTPGWGRRAEVGITGGPADADWDLFSVQWDGMLTIPRDGTRLCTRSDDSSRMWIDINGDGQFDQAGAELVNNHWGSGQSATTGPASAPLAAGEYRIRIQYEEQYGGNILQLLWDDSGHSAGGASGGPVRAAGTLSGMDDVDLFDVELTAGQTYEFHLESPAVGLAVQDRLVGLYNEFGQLLVYAVNGSLQTNIAQTGSGRYILMVSALTPLGLGGYCLTGSSTGSFPVQRDVPRYYFDFTGTGTYWGYAAGAYERPDAIPQIMAGFQSSYGIYDIDMTLTPPAAGTEYVTVAVGTFPEMGWGGLGGGSQGNRQVSGTAACKIWNETTWSRLQDVDWAFGVTKHEAGHATGFVPHLQHGRGIMAGDGQLFSIQQVFEGNGGGGLPSRSVYRERDYLDWMTQAGRIGSEVEPNGMLDIAQDLTAWLAEMAADGDPRDDRVVVHARIDGPQDVDVYRITVAAGETFSWDLDSAEFQYPLDAVLRILDGSGAELARSDNALDRETGLASVDPYLRYRFSQAGTYYVQVSAARGTFGPYRFKVTPERASDGAGPRVYASWPDGGAAIDSTRQLTFWFDDQLDPATLTPQNIEVRGANSGTVAGIALFDPLYSTLVWKADAPLAIDTYTVTFRSGSEGVRNLRGNPLDGETQGTLSWPGVSGDGSPGGDFRTTFLVQATDSTPAQVTAFDFEENYFNRDRITVRFSDDIDALSVATAQLVLRGSGPDGRFETADDTEHLFDLAYDSIPNTVDPQLLVYTRGRLDVGDYRLEGTLQDAAGHAVPMRRTFAVGLSVVPGAFLSQSPGGPTGLTGSYFNRSFRYEPAAEDWRQNRTVAGTRIDRQLDFATDTWGTRAAVGITGGSSDANWEDFSVQWDGFVTVPETGVRLATRSDDGSRMWIDLNGDGQFEPLVPELVDNHWGSGQAATVGSLSPPLPAGTYRLRIQYEEGYGGNELYLLWQNPAEYVRSGKVFRAPSVVAMNVQPGSALTGPVDRLDITFSSAVAPASLQTDAVRLRYSPDPVFFDGTDVLVQDADGVTVWDPAHNRATFRPNAPFAPGYYLLELDGGPGGIASPLGLALDGEYLDSYVQGNTLATHWQTSPSGDGIPGGDYRAFFQVLGVHRPWYNPVLPADVDGSDDVAPLDALLVINYINFVGTAVPGDATSEPPYYDVSGDNQVTADDVLRVVNHLNAHIPGVFAGEGEGEGKGPIAAFADGRPVSDSRLGNASVVSAVAVSAGVAPAAHDAVFTACYASRDGGADARRHRRTRPAPPPQAADDLFSGVGDQTPLAELGDELLENLRIAG